MYLLLCISLALTYLLAVNLLAAGLASAIWQTLAAKAAKLSPTMRSQLTFGLRILPFTGAVVFVTAYAVPAYLIHEPGTSDEAVGVKLALLAAVSLAALTFALYRFIRTWVITRRLTIRWQADAEPIEVDGVNVPVFMITHKYPLLAVVGVLKPRMFVARQVLEALDPAEFQAAVAHEYGHLNAHDNFKRTLLRICRDSLLVPFGSRIDRAWAESSEAVADEFSAGNDDGSTALDLASALVKIGKMVPHGAVPAMPAGSFFTEMQAGDITFRVGRLIQLSDGHASPEALRSGSSAAAWLWSIAFVAALTLPFADDRIHVSVHSVTETIVHLLR